MTFNGTMAALAGRGARISVLCALIAALGLSTTATAQIIGSVSLNVERRGHTATALGDGRVLIVGGENHAGVGGETEVLDPVARTSAIVATSLVARTDHTATRLPDGRVLIAGGRNQIGPLDSTEIYNPLAVAFSPAGQLARPRAGHTATQLADGRILIVGGDAAGSGAP